jgi:ArsR family transcriptional regulator
MLAALWIGGFMDDRIEPRTQATLERAASMIKCLGHPLRLRLLEAMEDGERTVTDLAQFLGAPQAVVSQQLGILRGRAVVSATRRGPHVFYGITEPRVQHILDCIRTCDGFRRSGSPAPAS